MRNMEGRRNLTFKHGVGDSFKLTSSNTTVGNFDVCAQKNIKVKPKQ